MIELQHVSKHYGKTVAVEDINVVIQPGKVTGFLGPNGSGKSTTMRMILGLDRPSDGQVFVQGRRYVDEIAPLHQIGALLDAKAVHPSRSAYNHLWGVAQTNGIPKTRVQEVLEMVGLQTVAKRPAGKFSLGMSQRLGIATAMLGDPDIVLLDEPINGLDPEGIIWIRHLMLQLAQQGKTVFISSHLMSEMAQFADHLIIIGRGNVLADIPTQQFIDEASTHGVVYVESPQHRQLQAALERQPGAAVTHEANGLQVQGVPSAVIGEIAVQQHLQLNQLVTKQVSLEEAYIALTASSVEYHAINQEDTVERIAEEPALPKIDMEPAALPAVTETDEEPS